MFFIDKSTLSLQKVETSHTYGKYNIIAGRIVSNFQQANDSFRTYLVSRFRKG